MASCKTQATARSCCSALVRACSISGPARSRPVQRAFSQPLPSVSAVRQWHAQALSGFACKENRGRKSTVFKASWGAPVTFSPAKIVSNQKAATDLHKLLIDVGEAAAAYTKPGQFIQIKVGDSKPGFFAIASAPDPNNQGVLELLIKKQGGTAELLCDIAKNAEVEVSPVMGKGFPIDKIPATDISTVLMFATGSGISPLKALIESGVLDTKQRKDVRLYYGTRSEDRTAFKDLLPAWEAAGVKTIQVYSSEGGKYVQDVFKTNMGVSEPSKVGVVMCGHKGMVEAVTAALTEVGVEKDKILLNF